MKPCVSKYKGVPEGGLSPASFNPRTETPEILLLSGIYWDLVKLYDQTKSQDRQKDFAHYLQQFIKFSKDMPHQHVSAETLRRYLVTTRAVHKDELKNAYRILNTSRCFVVSELIEETNEETLGLFRAFRDARLLRSSGGRVLVRAYYAIGPIVAYALRGASPAVRRWTGKALDRLACLVK